MRSSNVLLIKLKKCLKKGFVYFWLFLYHVHVILTPMLDKWLSRIIFLIFMFLWPPIGLLAIVLPALSNLDFSHYTWLPSLLMFVFIVLWFIDYGGAIWLLYKWANEEST